jgi:hypothetical protein
VLICTGLFGQFIGIIGQIEEKKKQNRMIKAVMGVEQTTETTTVYI